MYKLCYPKMKRDHAFLGAEDGPLSSYGYQACISTKVQR